MRVSIKLLSLFAVLILLAAAAGCDSGNGGNNQALTENDFANNAALRADPDKQIIVDFLEPPDSDTPQNDTGPVGIDEIPVKYPEIIEQTFCWEDDDVDAMHFMELRDSEGSLVLTVEANGECVTEVIEAGNYVMTIHHDGRIEDAFPIFLIPNPDQNQQARETDGLYNGFKVVIAKILKGIQNTISKDARAQTDVRENINTLIDTNSCDNCNLRTADFSDAILRDADLRDSDLSLADFSNARLSRADLTNADLYRANLSRASCYAAIFTDADLRVADLRDAGLRNAYLIGANLSGANLSGDLSSGARCGEANFSDAILRDADLRNADLSGADLTGANLTGARWCDGKCHCDPSSFGTCVGCAPVEEVCTGS